MKIQLNLISLWSLRSVQLKRSVCGASVTLTEHCNGAQNGAGLLHVIHFLHSEEGTTRSLMDQTNLQF